MQFHVHHYINYGGGLEEKLDRILELLNLVLKKENVIMSLETEALDRAEAAAKANSDADDAAEALLNTIASLVKDLKANATDPAVAARIDALGTAISDRAARLSAAVVAGTPAA